MYCHRIAADVDTRTGTLAVQLEVANPQRLLHGQFARVQLAAIVYLLREVNPTNG